MVPWHALITLSDYCIFLKCVHGLLLLPFFPFAPCSIGNSRGSAATTTFAAVAAPRADLASAAVVARQQTDLRLFLLGAAAAASTQYLIRFLGTLPAVQYLVNRFIWWGSAMAPFEGKPALGASDAAAGALGGESEDGETVEWVNMCWRKAWRVYQRGLERWLAELLQPVFDNLVFDGKVPRFVQRLRIVEFTLDHEAPYFSNMRRRTSRKDSDLTGVVDVRYTGGARMVLLIECGTGRWRIKVPVMVTDLDLECKMWLKIRLAPMCPYVGTMSLAFVGPPSIKVQLAPYNRVRLMRIPILQPFLTKLLTIDLPALITLPERLEINIPPAVTAVAEAAVGRDAVMRAVASAVLQADALEHALISALPLGPQGAAGGISLPDLFQGELQVVLKEARDLPVWGFPWQSNPYARLVLGNQAVRSRRDSETSQASRHRAPVWNQEFQFLVEDPTVQELEVWVRDSPITGRTEVGRARLPLRDLARDVAMDIWLPVESSMPGERTQGAVHVNVSYKPFQDDDGDSGYREAAAHAASLDSQDEEEDGSGGSVITDVKSAADASSRANVAASAAAAAVAVTKAAAARAAARLARVQQRREEKEDEGGNDHGNGTGEALPRSSSSSGEQTGNAGPHQNDGGTEGALKKAPGLLDLAAFESLTQASKTNDTNAQMAAVKQLEAMTATMQLLTDEVNQINASNGSPDPESAGAAAAAAAKAVAAAEALAVAAVVAGDVAAANDALQDAATALETTVGKLASSDDFGRLNSTAASEAAAMKIEKETVLVAQTPQVRATQAIAAAQSAASAAAAAIESAHVATPAPDLALLETTPRDGGDPSSSSSSDNEDLYAPEAIPAAAGRGFDHRLDEELVMSSSDAELESTPAPWWNQALNLVPGVPQAHNIAAEAAAEADGSAAVLRRLSADDEAHIDGNGMWLEAAQVEVEAHGRAWWAPSWLPWGRKAGDDEASDRRKEAAATGESSSEERSQRSGGPLRDIIISPDIPIEEIAAEVQKSWKLRDRHVESLVQKALESRQRQSERPWLIMTSVMATSSAVLLAIVLYRLMQGSP